MAFPIRAASPGDIFDAEDELESSTTVPFFSLLPPLDGVEDELSFMASIRAASPDDTRGEPPPLASATLPPSLLSLLLPPEVIFPGAGGVDDPGGPPEGLGGKTEDLPLPLPLRAAILSEMLEPPPLFEAPYNRDAMNTTVRIEKGEVWLVEVSGSWKSSNLKANTAVERQDGGAGQALSRGFTRYKGKDDNSLGTERERLGRLKGVSNINSVNTTQVSNKCSAH